MTKMIDNSDELMVLLGNEYDVSIDFLNQLKPLVEKIYDLKTPLEARQNLLEQVHLTCENQVRNQIQLEELKKEQEKFQNSMGQLTEKLISIQGTANELKSHLMDLEYGKNPKAPKTYH